MSCDFTKIGVSAEKFKKAIEDYATIVRRARLNEKAKEVMEVAWTKTKEREKKIHE